jgi:hypothetical protein
LEKYQYEVLDMKKIVSIILAVAMVLALSLTAFTALAAVESPGKDDKDGITKITVQVNGKDTTEVEYERDEDNKRIITFTYTGDGDLQGWEFPGMEEGKDYVIVSQDGDTITIEVSEDYVGEVIANAIVDEQGEKKPTAKPDDGKKSPKTGIAATGILAMGAGAAVLALSKKKREND